MFWLAALVVLGLASVVVALARIAMQTAQDYDEHMPDIEGL